MQNQDPRARIPNSFCLLLPNKHDHRCPTISPGDVDILSRRQGSSSSERNVGWSGREQTIDVDAGTQATAARTRKPQKTRD